MKLNIGIEVDPLFKAVLKRAIRDESFASFLKENFFDENEKPNDDFFDIVTVEEGVLKIMVPQSVKDAYEALPKE